MYRRILEQIAKTPLSKFAAEKIKKAVDEKINEVITLELSRDEAEVLVKVSSYIGGSPAEGHPRKFFDDVGRKLRDLGVGFPEGVTATGSVYIDTEFSETE